ncbi:MAG TPA: aldo/keto reductase [Bryobacteraceae bacterium]|jgi:aryl-alcohol dehydrogenase-like predicted oxidoreductase|nr:aldo/keto reductase [Bryobacteraceae bacterium]
MTTTKREIGDSGIEVTPLAFGGNVFGWTVDEPTSFRLLDAFADRGFDLIDTADVYSRWVPGHQGGESETIIGNWLARTGKRSRAVIATKVGMEMAPDKKGLSRSYILRAAEDSLKRLRTDYIDLYQSHQDDAATPLDETLRAYQDLIKQGKVRAVGASNYTASRLSEALSVSEREGLPRYVSLQPLYNLYDREDYEAQLEEVCREYNLGVFPYFSLASGFLTGKYRSLSDTDGKARGTRAAKYLNERGFEILKALDTVAAENHSTPAKVAIAWLLAKPTVTAPIASATNLSQLEDLFDAVDLQLDEDSINVLDQASAWRLEAASA